MYTFFIVQLYLALQIREGTNIWQNNNVDNNNKIDYEIIATVFMY